MRYGWIDGQKGKLDDDFRLQRFTPRSALSRWSKANLEKVTALVEQGRMAAPGLGEVERAKADGRWEAAAEFFKALDSQNRYSILYRVQDAKKPETRTRRIEKYVGMLANHEKIHL